MSKRHLFVAAATSAALLLAACGSDDDTSADTTADTTPVTTPATDPMTTEAPAADDIVTIASGNPDFSTLVAAVQAAGLVETLQGEGPFTVFAPTNDAFAALPEGLVDALLLPENKDALTQVLTYHVVSGAVMAADVTAGDVPTVQGENLAVTVDGGTVMVNDATVTATDIVASNGVIHVIDSVLVPPSLDVSTLLPAESTDTTEMAEEMGDIVAVASGNPDFSTLVAAVDAAGLVETLQGEGPFTVFAPTNDAFAALPEGLVDALLLPENKDVLVQILTYHVVAGKVLAADVTAGDVPTVEGSNITITTDDGVKVNDANVVATDVEASNGVIHVLDAVIVPPGLDVTALL
jgi:transforming growth factor-beta-induced protein